MCASFPQKNKTLPLIFSLMLKALLNRNCLPSLKVICFSNTSSFQYFIPNNLSLDSWCMTLHTSLYDFVFCHVRLSKRVPYVCGGYEGGSRGKKVGKIRPLRDALLLALICYFIVLEVSAEWLSKK